MMVTMGMVGFRCSAWERRHETGCKRVALERGTMCFIGVQWCSVCVAGAPHGRGVLGCWPSGCVFRCVLYDVECCEVVGPTPFLQM